MITIDNQPIVFNLDQSCDYPIIYDQIINQGDITQFQFKLETCFGSPQLLTNESFAGNLNGWTIAGVGFGYESGGFAVKTGTATSLIRQSVLTLGKYYQAQVMITSVTSDDDNIAEIRFGAGTRVFPLKAGLNTVYGQATNNTNFEIRCNQNSQIKVEYALVYEVNIAYKVILLNDTDEPVDTIDLLTETLPFIDTDTFNITDEFVTVSLDWNNLQIGEGCFKIGMADPCINTNLQNGMFNGDFHLDGFGYQVTNNAINPSTITYNNQLEVAAPDLNLTEIRYIYEELGQSLEYTCTYTVTLDNSLFAMNYGGNFGTTRNTSGTFTETVTSAGKFLTLVVQITSTMSGPGSLILDDIKIELANVSDYQSNFTSEPLKIGNFDCTNLLRISNDIPAFGFDFTVFAPSVRLRSDLRGGTDRSEREFTRNSNGGKKVFFADVILSEDLAIGPEPNYIHDFLRLCAYSNYFYINEVSYFIEDDEYPDISWNKQQTKGSVTLDVSENKLNLNQNCTGVITGGNSGQSSLGSGGASSSGGSGQDILIFEDKDTFITP